MAVRATELESGLIDEVLARLREQLPDGQAAAAARFVRQYYHWVPRADLAQRDPRALCGAALTHWGALLRRPGAETRVRVYNPTLERDGWSSPHTVIQAVTEDMPFLVDTVTMDLARGHDIKLVIHPVINVRRDSGGKLVDVLEPGDSAPDAIAESAIHAEVARESDPDALEALRLELEHLLGQVREVVDDWPAMRQRAQALIGETDVGGPGLDPAESSEASRFLRWLTDDHFTFLGFRGYELVVQDGATGLRAVPDSGLGILCGPSRTPYYELAPDTLALLRTPRSLILTKGNSRAPVHRSAYLDYVGVKRFGADGQVVGEDRFLGLYTTAAYREPVSVIPLLRGKLRYVLEQSGFPEHSHDAKALVEIVESYPRDSLFQIAPDELFTISMGILGLGERQQLRCFARRDPFNRFMACLVCIPRDRFNAENRERIAAILTEAFSGTHVEMNPMLSESLLARVHYIVHTPDGVADSSVAEVEARLVEATRAWADDLMDALIQDAGEERAGSLHRRYARAFPAAYREDWDAQGAVGDISRIEALDDAEGPTLSLYRPRDAGAGQLRCKLFTNTEVSLSDVLPTFEHMGARVTDERPYEISPAGSAPVWVYDFGLRCATDELSRVATLFQDAVLGAWRGELEDDGLNQLVLGAGLTGRQVTVIRAIAKYLRQAGIPFSDDYGARTLVGHPEVVRQLVELFAARFDPDAPDREPAQDIAKQIETAIDAVQSLDEDRILRSFLSVVQAILRTNYFCVDEAGSPRPYLSFKLDPEQVPVLPLPRPRFEIFVYSPRVEGVHLRGGYVARGGLRWSDRLEDFRTEILGLMKAQMVKNALIVPVGAKGGFVVKRPPADGGRDALRAEGIECYRMFLRGLLDLTDNIVGGEVRPPERVVRYDEDDPYLVVAADKGTASFSDVANTVSAEYGYWLGDAFASGGSCGYDHKQMGITARGAWESVKRHFRELGTDVQRTAFTVVGIGDMSGDVFGNGMLLSRHIRLLAAFNHLHVFLDPDPDPEASFVERERLFGLGRSGWSDYEPSAISSGGGVHSREVKSIPITPEVGAALGIEASRLTPTELIGELLRAPVDLLWNGGIGTYVKAAGESHHDAGDKANDAVRVDGGELRCRVVGEGGNLGFTQRGRIEYALAGGAVNTDAIDNVAGVNCSDHEVNIKILLGGRLSDGEMTEEQRNDLLVEMTDAVAAQVLAGSYTQTQALSIACEQSAAMADVHQRLIRRLEQVAGLHRALESLPSDEEIEERRHRHTGLLAPELAVVMAHCKIHLHAELLQSDVPEDPYLAYDDLRSYFPAPLPERYGPEMRGHRLRREIIATVVANQLVDRAGSTFVFRLEEETGAPASSIARAFAVSREVFEMRSYWREVQALDNQLDAKVQLSMFLDGRRLVERATRWLLRGNPDEIDISLMTRCFAPGAELLAGALPGVLGGADREAFDRRREELTRAGVPEPLAGRAAGLDSMLAVFDIVEVAQDSGREPAVVMETYFELGSRLELDWLRDRIIELPRENRWEALARAALRDDLQNLRRLLTSEVLATGGPRAGSARTIEAWAAGRQPRIERCQKMLAEIRSARAYDTTTLPVALREVRNLLSGVGSGGAFSRAGSVTLVG